MTLMTFNHSTALLRSYYISQKQIHKQIQSGMGNNSSSDLPNPATDLRGRFSQRSIKLLVCADCGTNLKEENRLQHEESCQKWKSPCPRGCDVSIPRCGLAAHLEECPEEEAACPHIQALGCSKTCPERLRRKDIDSHLADPSTVSAVMRHIASQHKRQKGDAGVESSSVPVMAPPEVKRKRSTEGLAIDDDDDDDHNNLDDHIDDDIDDDDDDDDDVENDDVDDVDDDHLSLRGKEYFSSWRLEPCMQSREILLQQLKQRKAVEGEKWTTYHIAYEFHGQTLMHQKGYFCLNSTSYELDEGIKVCITLEHSEEGTEIDFVLCISGFEGKAEYTIAAFRFGLGAPKHKSGTDIFGKENGMNCSHVVCSIKDDELVSGGWLVANSTLPVLATLHLRR